MSKTYYLRFGSGDPRTLTGLSPTFLIFSQNGSNVTPPSIAEVTGATGLYSFAWGTTTSIVFLADAATTSPGVSGRYVVGALDPVDRVDEVGTTLVAIGTSNIALGTTNAALGTTAVSYGLINNQQGSTIFALGTTAVALGVTNVALGTTNIALDTNIGTTLVAIGNTAIALGTTNIAYGVTVVAIGTTLTAGQINLGSTLVAIGNTAITGIGNQGSTLVAIGNTAISIGTTNVALGTTNVAIGTTITAIATSLMALSTSLNVVIAGIGSTASSFGTDIADPVDLFGYLKRIQENLEGNQSFVKLAGALSIYSRNSSQLIASKTITNSASTVIKT